MMFQMPDALSVRNLPLLTISFSMYEKKGIADMFCLNRTVMVFMRLSLYVYVHVRVRVRVGVNKKHEFVNPNGSVLRDGLSSLTQSSASP